MTKELTVIESREILGKEFTMYGTFEEPWFIAKQISNWIGHSDTSMMLKPIDDTEKLIQTILVSGQNREVWMVSEYGLYEILMLSRKPVAKEFKSKIKELLKGVRTGQLLILKKLADVNNEKIQNYDKLTSATNHMNMLEVSKSIKLCGRNTLFKILREEKILMNAGTRKNIPYEKYIKSGYFSVIMTTILRKGELHDVAVCMVSPKGIDFILKLIRKRELIKI